MLRQFLKSLSHFQAQVKRAKMENTKSKVIPKSLSVSAILNLGRVVKSGTTMVNLNTFHLDTMVW